jgi:hypothetical protein
MNAFLDKLWRSQKATNMKHHILLVFDIDVSKSQFKSKLSEALRFLVTTVRYHCITVVVSTIAISPVIRGNTHYVFWDRHRLDKRELRDNVYKFMAISDFRALQEHIANVNTSDYRFIFYDNITDAKDERIRLVDTRSNSNSD